MNNSLISCCTHPTLVVAVDDNRKYHNVIKLAIDSRRAICRFYADPSKALHFLAEQYIPDPFINRCVHEPEDQAADKRSIEVDIRAIYHEIYNPQRFEEVSVVIVDYAMPGLNGGELAQQLKNLAFKIILLTGEADAQVAVKLFNQGVIHSYIRKDDPHFDSLLNSAIHNLQDEYFQELSTIVTNTLAQSPDKPRYWFKDPLLKELLQQICNENDIVECYLLDEFGSFLLINAQGTPSWFAVTDEEMMQTYVILAETDDAPIEIVHSLKNKTALPFFFNEQDFMARPAQWHPYLHPAEILQGHETYYYSYITNPNAYHIDPFKMLTYEKFLEKQT